jgi:hypothetical protein
MSYSYNVVLRRFVPSYSVYEFTINNAVLEIGALFVVYNDSPHIVIHVD